MNKSLLTFGLLMILCLAPNATAGNLNIRPLEILERFNQPTLERSGLERSGLERSTFGQPALERNAQAAPNSWTILVYLHADHNLEGSSVTDLEEMEQVGSSAGFKIVYQWDRNETPSVVRGEVTKSPADGVQSRTVQKLPGLNSDDPKVLADFVRWGIKTYPAQRYGLIMWDHGGQWQGFGGDEQNGQNAQRHVLDAGRCG
jgi:Clostripain family